MRNLHMRNLLAACAVAALAAACSPAPVKKAEAPAAPAAAPVKVEIPAGAYTLDPLHSTLIAKMEHLGFSMYTVRFDDWTAKLQLDPANLAATMLEVSIDPRSLGLPHPPEGFKDELLGKDWLDAARFSTVTFKSTSVQPTGPDTAIISGDLTLRGVTRPVALQAKFNGGYAGFAMDPAARAGFSAHGAFKRSDFGMTYGVPAPGSKMGVGDEVQLVVESEFTGPPLKK
jgi:polyisoprenoid-binding protein YceI